MRERMQRFMMGRYGVDSLSKLMVGIAFAAVLISMFTGYTWIYVLGLVALIYSYFRSFSRNQQKRYAEYEAYMRLTGGIRRFFKNKKTHITQAKTHKFFRCPGCKQDIRVPKGKGRIMITCPKCRTSFEKQT